MTDNAWLRWNFLSKLQAGPPAEAEREEIGMTWPEAVVMVAFCAMGAIGLWAMYRGTTDSHCPKCDAEQRCSRQGKETR